jgi:hypothetical protein
MQSHPYEALPTAIEVDRWQFSNVIAGSQQ